MKFAFQLFLIILVTIVRQFQYLLQLSIKKKTFSILLVQYYISLLRFCRFQIIKSPNTNFPEYVILVLIYAIYYHNLPIYEGELIHGFIRKEDVNDSE